jgi:hypothetical protein
MDWGQIFKEYGLPLTMLLAFGLAVIKGYLVPGPTHEDVKKQRDKALDLVYALATSKGEKGEHGEQGNRGQKGQRGSAARSEQEGR